MSRRRKVDLDVLEQAYQEAAEEAASVERSGNYAKAIDLWAEAEKCAVTITQREWCNTRRTYCKKWQGKRERTQ
ncbi:MULTISPECIES: ANR family transcriptional regulator [Rodentibacter]|uniref:ANR family transcriptional regulator n=1 Tax=Rodentibacter TaxID=1960084 RepID=UPI001094403E|nr:MULTISPECIES: ANR family transcriptional regulator [Pasteurellaceae]MCR1838329.1 ANR family transcriptional regulator [Pasteurella caecimuris]MCU0107560.1 ANR family transcriptional regulator [Pasteurella caecimuris]NBH76244.1 ANR family transcriptional regulator [Rodentibacter pneumotropicus]TGY49612.1 ANR family transcriptional regulator [Pasteurella caecimuris]THA07155.1 ANR family transcriptional regulator [Rodentibacter pneumotropicus]